jgi:hypothetical protein
MVMKRDFKILILFFSLTFILSCNKNEVSLSPASPESNEDFFSTKPGISAIINESDFSSALYSPYAGNVTDTIRIDNAQSAPFYATYGSDSTSLIILADGKLNNQDTVNWAQILLWVTRFKGEDTYPIEDGSSLGVFSVVDTSNNLRQFFSSGTPNGSVIINQFDAGNNTISGTFEFSALSNDSLLTVKKGVFNSVKIN